MKVIDLLNKIANGEDAPKKIIYKKETYYLENRHYVDDSYTDLFENNIYAEILNDEVEIIEDKKIKKLKKEKRISGMLDNEIQYIEGYKLEDVGDKINEIIDKINEVE